MKVIIMKGLPGAGKSTWVANNAPDAVVCSADHFLVENGQYIWTPERLGDAHAACKRLFESATAQYVQKPLIVVDNCNLTSRDMRFYVEMAIERGYQVEIRTLDCDPEVAQKRCLHGVPADKYKLLVNRFNNPLPAAWQRYEVRS